MADEPRKPSKAATPSKGVSLPRPATERGEPGVDLDRDRRVTKAPPVRIQHELAQSPTARHKRPAFEEEEITPVTMIKLVREELKDDIVAVDNKVEEVADQVKSLDNSIDGMMQSVAKLTGEVATTNQFLPQMLTTLQQELQSKRTIDEEVVLSQVKVKQHREITSIDSEEADKRVTRKARLKLISLVTSTSLITWILAFVASKCSS